MRELIACWQNTRIIVLIGVCAALYAAVLLASKWIPIIPNYTEIRPGAALPIVFSVFFGPAAAWGSAFGNTIADLFGGTISLGTIPGFVGNLLYGYAPYRILRAFSKNDPGAKTPIPFLLLGIVIASGLCAIVISLVVAFLGLVPFDFLANAILLVNISMSVILAPLLIRTLERRIVQMKLSYRQLLKPDQISTPLLGVAGAMIVLILLLLVYCIMMFPALNHALAFLGTGSKLFPLVASVVLTVAALLFL